MVMLLGSEKREIAAPSNRKIIVSKAQNLIASAVSGNWRRRRHVQSPPKQTMLIPESRLTIPSRSPPKQILDLNISACPILQTTPSSPPERRQAPEQKEQRPEEEALACALSGSRWCPRAWARRGRRHREGGGKDPSFPRGRRAS